MRNCGNLRTVAQPIALTAGLLFLLLHCPLAGHSQQPAPCPRPVVPVGVALADGRMVRGLSAKDFQAKLQGKKATVAAVSRDLSPRRILLLLDARRSMNETAWKLATILLHELVSKARAEDSLALATFGAEHDIRADFGTSRTELRERLASLTAQRPGGKGADAAGLFASIESEAGRFALRGYGDAILVFAGKPDYESEASAIRAKKILNASSVRAFGFGLSERASPASYASLPGARLEAVTIVSLPLNQGESVRPALLEQQLHTIHLADMVRSAGGFLIIENTEAASTTYTLNDARLAALQQAVWRMYGNTVEFYRVELDAEFRGGEKIDIEISDEIRKKVPGASLLRPERLPACGTQPSPD